MSKVLKNTQIIPSNDLKDLVRTLHSRFDNNMQRHPTVSWQSVLAKLNQSENENKILSLFEMERTGGEPDLVEFDKKTDSFFFYDCSKESPIGRRSLCYDRAAWISRKANKPSNSAIDFATEMGIEILDETQYRRLQEKGRFDTKTSSWLKTSPEIRALGGAVFGDCRYNQVFLYHNGADSYYASRGFRGWLKI